VGGGLTSRNFTTRRAHKTGVITWVQLLEGVPQQNLKGQKTSKIWRSLWQLSTLSANNSEIYRHSENLKNKWSTTTPPTLEVKKLVNFGPQTKNYRRACWPTQLDFFRETIFRPLGSAAPCNFYTRYNPLNCIPVGLGAPAASRWALPHISS